MKKWTVFLLLTIFTGAGIFAQSADSNDLHSTAKKFMMQGDFNNAVLVLNRALENDKTNLGLLKDLAFSQYLNRNFVEAMQVAKPLADRADADIQTFQILGMIYNAVEEKKDAERMYKAAFKKFPESGVLHNEYGELLISRKLPNDAVRYWEKGIELEPNYSGNYYNLSKYYLTATDNIWGLIYGEIFVNLESYSKRTPEIKGLVYEGYKKLFTSPDLSKNQNIRNEFVKAYTDHLKNQLKIVEKGVSPESLSALRTRFILDWYNKDATRFPFKLFEYHQQLLKEGLFEAYNQWIFGSARDLAAYQNWTTTHSEEYSKFKYFQENRVFKLPPAQYYNTASK